MTTRRLSEIDLARFAAIPAGEQLEQALRKHKAGFGPWSYGPVRQSTADILAARTPLLGKSLDVPWLNIAAQIEQACSKGADQVEANLEVGKILYEATRRLGWITVQIEMGRLPIGQGQSVRYWTDTVIDDGDGPFIPFLDHRRNGGITNASNRQIVFSMQNLWIRERNPDLMDSRLAVIKFPCWKDERTIDIEFHDDAELLRYEELDARVCTVYETWARVSAERVRETRRTGTDGTTPFGF